MLLNPPDELVRPCRTPPVITDVGSVKQPVLDVWSQRHPRFVASRIPWLEQLESGVEAGVLDLFRGRPWIATPEAATDADAAQQIQQLAEALGAHWIQADPLIHDQAVALISHLPVMVSAALLRAVGEERDPRVRELAMQLASSGFADTTRVGGGNPALGTAMASPNTGCLAQGARRLPLES